MLGVIQRLQEGAITRPGMVTQTQVAILPPANLDGSEHTNTYAQVLGKSGLELQIPFLKSHFINVADQFCDLALIKSSSWSLHCSRCIKFSL